MILLGVGILALSALDPCIAKLRLPVADVWAYGPSGGEIKATITIGKDGRPPKVKTDRGESNQVADITRAISSSSFHARCAGKSIVVIFEYRYFGEPSEVPIVQYELAPPNKVIVLVAPLIPNVFETPPQE